MMPTFEFNKDYKSNTPSDHSKYLIRRFVDELVNFHEAKRAAIIHVKMILESASKTIPVFEEQKNIVCSEDFYKKVLGCLEKIKFKWEG